MSLFKSKTDSDFQPHTGHVPITRLFGGRVTVATPQEEQTLTRCPAATCEPSRGWVITSWGGGDSEEYSGDLPTGKTVF